MRTQLLKSFGLDSSFELTQYPVPTLTPGHVLIKVHYSSINPADYKAKELGHLLDFVPPLPAVLGMDFSGVVEAIGTGVTGFAPGDKVFGCAGGVKDLPGTLAEYLLADQRLISHAPTSLSLREAAALPLISITAWEGIVEAGVLPGDKILVFGGGGNVGRMAVQLAKLSGASVLSVERSSKTLRAKETDADQVVEAGTSIRDIVDQYTAGRGFALVFDTVGGDHLTRAFEAARIEGKVTTTIGLTHLDLSLMHTKALTLRVIYMLTPMLYNQGREKHGRILQKIASLTDQQKLIPPVDPKTFSLEEATAAYSYAASGEAVGKVIIDIH